MTLKIDEGELPPSARESLARGAAVEVVRAGETVAILQPGAGARGGLRAFYQARLETGPTDEEWGENIEEWAGEMGQFARWANYTGGLDPWDDMDRAEEWKARQERVRGLLARRKARSARSRT